MISVREKFRALVSQPSPGCITFPIWLILHKGTLYEERGPAVSKRSKYQRMWRMIRQLQQLGYRIESPNPQASQAQA